MLIARAKARQEPRLTAQCRSYAARSKWNEVPDTHALSAIDEPGATGPRLPMIREGSKKNTFSAGDGDGRQSLLTISQSPAGVGFARSGTEMHSMLCDVPASVLDFVRNSLMRPLLAAGFCMRTDR